MSLVLLKAPNNNRAKAALHAMNCISKILRVWAGTGDNWIVKLKANRLDAEVNQP